MNSDASIARDAARKAADFASPFLLIRIMCDLVGDEHCRDAASTVLSLSDVDLKLDERGGVRTAVELGTLRPAPNRLMFHKMAERANYRRVFHCLYSQIVAELSQVPAARVRINTAEPIGRAARLRPAVEYLQIDCSS